jgi:hypothetical protein
MKRSSHSKRIGYPTNMRCDSVVPLVFDIIFWNYFDSVVPFVFDIIFWNYSDSVVPFVFDIIFWNYSKTKGTTLSE